MLLLPLRLIARGVVLRLFPGHRLSSRSSTKLEGNKPTACLLRFSRPIHQAPSPALRHSIKSPSINPRSRLVWGAGVSHAGKK